MHQALWIGFYDSAPRILDPALEWVCDHGIIQEVGIQKHNSALRNRKRDWPCRINNPSIQNRFKIISENKSWSDPDSQNLQRNHQWLKGVTFDWIRASRSETWECCSRSKRSWYQNHWLWLICSYSRIIAILKQRNKDLHPI